VSISEQYGNAGWTREHHGPIYFFLKSEHRPQALVHFSAINCGLALQCPNKVHSRHPVLLFTHIVGDNGPNEGKGPKESLLNGGPSSGNGPKDGPKNESGPGY